MPFLKNSKKQNGFSGLQKNFSQNILLVACIAFVLLFFLVSANNDFEMLGDTQDYLAMAHSFFEGHPLQDPSRPYFLPLILHPPLYSIFLAAFFWLFGFSYLGAKVVSVFFGILSVLAFYFLLKDAGIKHKGLALLAYSTSAVFLIQANRILSDTVFMLFLILGVYFILQYEKKKATLDLSGMLSGIFFGLAFYARIAILPFVLATIVYFALKKDWKKVALIFAVFAAIALPWAIFFANYQFFQSNLFEKPESYVNWATDTWQTSSGENSAIGIFFRFFYNLFYFVFEGIPKTIFPALLPLFFSLRHTIFLPVLYVIGGVVFFFFGKTLFKTLFNNKRHLFGFYIVFYILFFAVQPALDDVTFVDRYLLGIFPFMIIFLDKTLQGGFFSKKKIGTHVFVAIVLFGVLFSGVAAATMKGRMLDRFYVGFMESTQFVKENVPKDKVIVSTAPIHVYLNTGNKAIKNFDDAEKTNASYIITDGWTKINEKKLENFETIFESSNKTSKVLKRKT